MRTAASGAFTDPRCWCSTAGTGDRSSENGISWPAIFIVDKDGKILWRSLAQTDKIRAMLGQILEALPQ